MLNSIEEIRKMKNLGTDNCPCISCTEANIRYNGIKGQIKNYAKEEYLRKSYLGLIAVSDAHFMEGYMQMFTGNPEHPDVPIYLTYIAKHAEKGARLIQEALSVKDSN